MEKFPKTPKPSKTLEDVLKARGEGDLRALRGALILHAGKPKIVFGAMGDIPRFSLEIDGNEIKVLAPQQNEDPEAPGKP